MQLMMKRALFTILSAVCALSAQGQSDDWTLGIEISIELPAPECTLENGANLSFGAWVAPRSGSESVVADATDGTIDSDDLTEGTGGTKAIGYVEVSYVDANSFTIDVTWPTSLSDDDSNTLTFTGAWAEHSSSSGTYTEVSGTEHDEDSPGGLGTSGTHYFRFGGTVSGISNSVEAGDYDNDATVYVLCS